MVGAQFPWTSARCNRLLRPLVSKIALLRKDTLSEPRHDQRNSGIALPLSFQHAKTAKKAENEWAISPRPWKKIKRTYSSKTKGQSFREAADHYKDLAIKESSDAVIRFHLHLTPGELVGNDKDLTATCTQHDVPAQTAPGRAPRAISKTVQVFHRSQDPGSADSTGLSNRRLIEGICKALEALLRATTHEKTNNNAGCRSLFSICLRKVPDYIAEEQSLTDHEDPKNEIDVASEVYGELEALGSPPDGGWESLREVVRAHGVSLVGEAIQEGLIELSLCRHILHLCFGLAAYNEAECVIKCMTAFAKSWPLPPRESTVSCANFSHPINKWAASHRLEFTSLTDKASRVVGALKYYVSQTGRHGFMYRQTAAMLADGILPVDWISSEAMIECWNGVIRSITQQDDHAQSAALLLQTAFLQSYRQEVSYAKSSAQVHDLRLHACKATTVRPTLRSSKSGQVVETFVDSQTKRPEEANARPDDMNNALQSTLFSLLTVVSAINILRSPKSRLDSSHPDLLSMGILRDMALQIHQVLELSKVTHHNNCSWSVTVRLPLLSAGLVSLASRRARTKISPNEVLDLATLARLPCSKESLRIAGSFLGEVARCCDRAGSGDGFLFVQVMVQDLISIATSSTYDKPTRTYCNGIAHAAAFAFSEDTGQPKHLDWALEMECILTRTVDDSPKLVVNKTPARDVTRNKSGYKWEEGICEWIAKTPALAMHQPNAIVDFDDNRTDEEIPKLTLVQELPIAPKTSPCVTDRQLCRPRPRLIGRGASCDSCEFGCAKGSSGTSHSTEELPFVRIFPRPQKVPRPHCPTKLDAANEIDELSTSESSQVQPVALREISNLPSGGKRKSFGGKHDGKVIGNYELDIPPRKRPRRNTQNFPCVSDDELGFQ